MQPTPIEIVAASLFAVALVHTFSTGVFERLAQRHRRHAGVLHLLGEVEVVFGLWALVLVLCMFVLLGRQAAVDYVDQRNFTEPLFVFAVMVIAGSRPVLQLAGRLVDGLARAVPAPPPIARYVLALSFLPLLGSFITEPAAMTLAAMMLRGQVFHESRSAPLRYATLGVLFVNVSIGGTLTAFAAPPVLMVAATWQWDGAFMLSTFGWRAALAVVCNAAIVTLLFQRELGASPPADAEPSADVPFGAMLASTLFLLATIVFAHHAAIFVAVLLFFIGYSVAYPRHHDPLILRQALLVAFFLGGLVTLGGQQAWWLRPLLLQMSPSQVYYGATALTALTDNAALTYLGSLVDGLSDAFKVSLVAGAVTGGGLTVIANAPNPAGLAIVRDGFASRSVDALKLLVAALPPTLVAIVAFRWL